MHGRTQFGAMEFGDWLLRVPSLVRVRNLVNLFALLCRVMCNYDWGEPAVSYR